MSLQKNRIVTHSSRCFYIRIELSHTAADVLTEGYDIHAQQQKDIQYYSCTEAEVPAEGYTMQTQQQKSLHKDILYSQTAAAVFTEGYTIHAQQQISSRRDN